MVDWGYWVETLLSRPREVITLLLTLAVFGVIAAAYPDRRDALAVGVGASVLAVVLAVVGLSVAGEWHYWAGGGILAGAAVLLVDTRRPDR